MAYKQTREQTIFQKQLEKAATRNIVFLVFIGCIFFSAAIFGINYLNTRFNVQEHIEFLTSTFQTAYHATDTYLNDAENDSIFTRCIENRTDGSEVRYSLSKYNVDSPIRLNLILTDSNHNIVYTSYGNDDMNLHRIAFNGIVCDNTVKNGPGLYHTVYYFTGDTSEYVFSRPLYRDGQLIGFAGAYLNGHDWARLFSNYQYDSIITTVNGDIIFCSREGFLPERNTNKFRNEEQQRLVFLHGNRYLLSSHFLKDEGVTIYSFIYYPKNVLYLAIGILTIVFLGVIWFIMTQKLSKLMAEKNARSVGILADEMRIIRHGDSSHIIEIHTGDEFEEIASQINRMVKSINELNTRNTDLIRLNSMIEISNLQTQINPHFIYNTLDTIKYLIMSEPDKAAHLIEKFTHILRYSINNTKQNVLLQEDMRYIEDYLYIQKTRFGDRFLCETAIAGECMRYDVPKLLLQPLIENSIKYGFKKRMEIRVTICGRCEGDYLYLSVEDNGPGVPRATLETLRAMLRSEELKTEHNGLQNLARRIVLEYGDNSEMTIDSREGEYFRVDIKLKNKERTTCTV
ncbi:histidine kinase [Hungatella hathewayi]|uniref:sensor histidine kinase n=1 Tax=Hungatella hathewayi TaxID=154046 RepID=UPI000335EA86|nr:histidine kinase [Hungatella hathewayi]CCZ59652.1 putative HAMP domain protein [Hungatella hathewayi CAG:224]